MIIASFHLRIKVILSLNGKELRCVRNCQNWILKIHSSGRARQTRKVLHVVNEERDAQTQVDMSLFAFELF